MSNEKNKKKYVIIRVPATDSIIQKLKLLPFGMKSLIFTKFLEAVEKSEGELSFKDKIFNIASGNFKIVINNDLPSSSDTESLIVEENKKISSTATQNAGFKQHQDSSSAISSLPKFR